MAKRPPRPPAELIIITGLSGSGKGSVLRALEDAGYYSVDNLPIELIPKFAELARDSPTVRRAALVVDIREGAGLQALPRHLRADPPQHPHAAAVPRSRRRHAGSPLQRNAPTASAGHRSLRSEKRSFPSAASWRPIRALADVIIDTSKFNVHDLRETIMREVSRRARGVEDHGLRHQLRLPPRRAGR